MNVAPSALRDVAHAGRREVRCCTATIGDGAELLGLERRAVRLLESRAAGVARRSRRTPRAVGASSVRRFVLASPVPAPPQTRFRMQPTVRPSVERAVAARRDRDRAGDVARASRRAATATSTSSASSAFSIRAFTRVAWTMPASGVQALDHDDVGVRAGACRPRRRRAPSASGRHRRRAVRRRLPRDRLGGGGDGRASAISSAESIALAVGDRLDERDAQALAIEGTHEAEAGGREADAAAGRSDENSRRHGVSVCRSTDQTRWRDVRRCPWQSSALRWWATTSACGRVAGRDAAVPARGRASRWRPGRASARGTRGGRSTSGAHGRRVLADAAGEDQGVEAAERHDQARDGLGEHVAEDVDRERRARVARRPPLPRPSACRSTARRRRAGPTSCSARRGSAFSGCPVASATWPMMAGSTDPLRVPIITPSSGVSPIVVSTLLPLRTAVHEQPLPRCAVTIA